MHNYAKVARFIMTCSTLKRFLNVFKLADSITLLGNEFQRSIILLQKSNLPMLVTTFLLYNLHELLARLLLSTYLKKFQLAKHYYE